MGKKSKKNKNSNPVMPLPAPVQQQVPVQTQEPPNHVVAQPSNSPVIQRDQVLATLPVYLGCSDENLHRQLLNENKLLKEQLEDKKTIIKQRDEYAESNEQLLKTIEELRKENADLKAELEKLKNKNTELENKVSKLENYIEDEKSNKLRKNLIRAARDIIVMENIYNLKLECKALRVERNNNAHYIDTETDMTKEEKIYRYQVFLEKLESASESIKNNLTSKINDSGQKLIERLKNITSEPYVVDPLDRELVDDAWR